MNKSDIFMIIAVAQRAETGRHPDILCKPDYAGRMP